MRWPKNSRRNGETKPKNNQAPFQLQTAQAPQAYCSIFLEFYTHHLFYARTKPGTNTKRIGPKTAKKEREKGPKLPTKHSSVPTGGPYSQYALSSNIQNTFYG